MKRITRSSPFGALAVFLCSTLIYSQQNLASPTGSATVAAAQLPRLVKFSGTLKDIHGNFVANFTGVTFALYSQETGGAPLWLETQNVQPDQNGRYTVMLGATKPEGLEMELFASKQAQWLGVRPEGQEEQARVLLVSVPYALKAGDAETIGGLPPSAFLLAPSINATVPLAPAANNEGSAGSVTRQTSSNVTTNGGTANALPLFTTATNIQNSIMTQNGTTGISVAGKLNLPATGTATASTGKNSRPLSFVASSFSSSISTPVNQTFQWQAEPAANDTPNPTGTINLLYGLGATTPSETGFKIASNGIVTFVSGQTFPGTGNGTITGITTASGSGLSGGGTSGTLSLKIAPAGVLNSMLAHPGITINAGTDLTGGGVVNLGGNTTLSLNTTATDARYAQLAAANTFSNTQSVQITTNSSSQVSGFSSTVLNQGQGYGVGFFGQGTFGVWGIGAVGVEGDAEGNGPGGIFNGFSSQSGVPIGSTAGIVATGGTGGQNGANDVDSPGGTFTGGHSSAGSGDGIDAIAGSGYAGHFTGNVSVTGTVSSGSAIFKIDHPLDPANRYLVHASVESSERMNIYTGNVTTDAQGQARVRLPEWFETLNTDFRYQLTVIGQFAQAIVAREIQNHEFEIRTNAPNVKVSWQVTGVRQDAFAKANPLAVEEQKDSRTRGYFIHPELYGAPREKQLEWARHPQLMKQMTERKRLAHPITVGAAKPPVNPGSK